MNSLEACECCWKRRGAWHEMDGAEMKLCQSCARQLREIGQDVSRLPYD